MALMISCTGTPQEDSEEVSGEASEKVASEDSPAPSEERLYQNPPEYVQISNTISTHGLDYYTSPVLVDNNSTKEDHIEALIETAYKYKGDPFIEGKSGPPGEGVDCSGLIMQACYGAGVDLWPSNPARHETQEYLWECAEIAEMDTLKTVPYEERQRGDLIFFTGRSGFVFHVAIYLGNDTLIHCTSVEYRVVITSMGDGMYGDVYRVKRIFN